jgi:ankyrin repeat protein
MRRMAQHSSPDPFGRSALHYAAAGGDLDDVAQLIAQGADPHEPDAAGFTPLHFAAQEQHADVAKLLLECGADIGARDRWGNTPLWRAILSARGDLATASVLLAAGADPDDENLSGVSPRRLSRTIGQPAL